MREQIHPRKIQDFKTFVVLYNLIIMLIFEYVFRYHQLCEQRLFTTGQWL